ncbi:MAG TPA: prepilin peptidase [Candidatus Sulfotelmatobacter sp.]|jgi:leader peptidase (prepilin peptidase)/N-methyltransferase|nr:prepilin peptidase [Candidatus Sulfotelmatobacter sp.]
MVLFFYLLIFVFGTTVGSFIGVIVDRLSSKEPIWKGRSHCDHCRHTLHAFDLIPLISFFLLKGKCRYCHKRLSWFYPLVEFSTGIAYLAIGIALLQQPTYLIGQFAYQLVFLYYFLLIGALVTIFFADVRYGIIPFKFVTFAFLVTLVWDIVFPFLPLSPYIRQFLGFQTNISNIIISAVGAGGFFFLLFAITKGRGMGFGDVVYACLMGFTLGFPRVILGLYIAFVTGAIISLILIALKKKKFNGGTIPFGPFLVFGTIISLLWGDVAIAYLMRFLNF